MLQLIWLSDQLKHIPNFMSHWIMLLHTEYIKYKPFLRSQRGASSHFSWQEYWFKLCEHPDDTKQGDGWNTWSLSAFRKEFCLCSFCPCMKRRLIFEAAASVLLLWQCQGWQLTRCLTPALTSGWQTRLPRWQRLDHSPTLLVQKKDYFFPFLSAFPFFFFFK